MILQRYIGIESLKTSAAVTSILLLIVLSSRLVRYLSEISIGDLSADSLFMLILLRIPSFLELLLPLGFFTGILLALGRMHTESEITVMQACGLSSLQLVKLVFLPIVLVSLITAALSLYITPASLHAYENLIKENKRASYSAVGGKFLLDHESGRMTYIEQYAPNSLQMKGVFTARPVMSEDGHSRYSIINAEYGTLGEDPESGDQYLILEDGYRIVGAPGSLDYQIASFKQYGQFIPDNTVNRYRNIKDGMSSITLLRSGKPEHIATLQWRLSLIFIVPIAAILAVGLSRTNPRSGRYAKLLPAILLYMAYLVSLNMIHAHILDERYFDHAVFLWIIHGIFAAVALTTLLWPDIVRKVSSRNSVRSRDYS